MGIKVNYFRVLDNIKGQLSISEVKEIFISIMFLKFANSIIKNNTVNVPFEADWYNN